MLKIENFPGDLHKKLKGLAVDSEETLREIIIRAAATEAERMEAERQASGQ
ncbi:MAG TPA: hypothetical protein VK611_25075 [Acidimicrobiales bacterium]|nr:hypothetical protein [Acidimicrobiales bacterium]